MVRGKRGRRSRGGRKVFGSRRDPVRHHIVLNDTVYNIIEAERKPDETNNECLLRMFREHGMTLNQLTEEKKDLQKKVDRLLERIEGRPIGIIQRNDMGDFISI